MKLIVPKKFCTQFFSQMIRRYISMTVFEGGAGGGESVSMMRNNSNREKNE